MKITQSIQKWIPFITLTALLLMSLGCGTSSKGAPSASDPGLLQTASADTTAVSVQKTLTASALNTPQLTSTPLPTESPIPSETPVFPISLTYEGVSIDCVCNKCFCLSGQSFAVQITIDSEGNITGTFEKYIPEVPDIALSGTKTNIFGSYRNGADYNEFTGALSEDLGYLNATLSFEGSDYSGKRVILFSRK